MDVMVVDRIHVVQENSQEDGDTGEDTRKSAKHANLLRLQAVGR